MPQPNPQPSQPGQSALGKPELVSLNGPDGVGKTTQIRLLATRLPQLQPLGSLHDHDPEPWAAAARGDYAHWWFEQTSPQTLTRMLLTSHAKRCAARNRDRVGLLDRGHSMLLAVAAATTAVKERRGIAEATDKIAAIAAAEPPAPPEFAVLLLPSRDLRRSLAITRARQQRPWTAPYPTYQVALHQALLAQAEAGHYHAIVDCDDNPIDHIHASILNALPPLGIPHEPTPHHTQDRTAVTPHRPKRPQNPETTR